MSLGLQIGEETQLHISFLLLDDALGEYGTDPWIGAIEAVPSSPEASRSLRQWHDVTKQLKCKLQVLSFCSVFGELPIWL